MGVKSIVAAAYATVVTSSNISLDASHEISAEGRFKEFLEATFKNYSADEAKDRLTTFSRNLDLIRHIQAVETGSATYSHLSPFADLAPEEFSKRHGFLYRSAKKSEAELQDSLDTSALPGDFDWVEKGAVNPVKNQGMCGSCWAFSTVANIEGAGFVTTGKLISLSEQELVDCDKKTGDLGCGGGLPSNAFKDMIASKFGLELESDYPYAGTRGGKCTWNPAKEVAFISGWKTIAPDENQMAAALVKYGPLSIGINAGPMQWYMGGIAHPLKLLCNPTSIDHGVAIVGFGTGKSWRGKELPYWKIRNSWGAFWGEKGYYRVFRGSNVCGLTSMVTTATGVTLKSSEQQELVV
eukprot:TRINITY_DN108840_c0_g1_i1.p1 TRINITY_DN108840_c0_g1~~TRINITY_DN108840_c0_g1_i1.p1  ORF type:complete len:353 (-),score=65.29 TRINITY_DN108840_c0_g1_i1:115-1173(-)